MKHYHVVNKDISYSLGMKVLIYLWKKQRRYTIANYIQMNKTHKLHLGCGHSYIDGWLNTDYWRYHDNCVYLDVRDRFPFVDSSIDFVFAEHVIEHVDYFDGLHMLRECYRVLCPGGVLRVVTPDFCTLLQLYLQSTESGRSYVSWIMENFLPDIASNYNSVFAVNNAFYNWNHRFVYDQDVLRESMHKAGFRSTKICTYGLSDHDSLDGIETHGVSIGSDAIAAYESLIVEGSK